MKVEKKTESFYILGYLLELMKKIWRFENENLKYGEFGSFFSNGKSFVYVEIIPIFARLKFGENSPVKETLQVVPGPCLFGHG
jgi:hypothetical protein